MMRLIGRLLMRARHISPASRNFTLRAGLIVSLLVSVVGVALMLTGGDYTLYPSKITYGGGVNSIGGGYSLSGGIGEPGGTLLTGGGYSVEGGIWQIIAEQLNDDDVPLPGECPAPPAGAPPLRPLVSFERPQPDGQYRIILWNSTQSLVMFDIVQSLSAICDADTCTITPDAQLLPFGVINGTNEIWIQHQPNGMWVKVSDFEINHPAPELVDNLSVNPNQGRPIISWTADSSATYFQLYVGRLEGGTIIEEFFNWIERTPEMCCGTTCSFKPEIYPPGGEHVVYIQAWGPGGLSPGGLADMGWNGPGNFSLPTTPPQIVTNLSTSNEDTGNPWFTWAGSQNVTWYQLWMGTVEPLETRLMDWYLAESLGCENAGVCGLSTTGLNLSGGTYQWYVQGWGPGGFAQGGIDGWAEGNEFVVGE